jgi:uncharacterized protein DUF6941
MRPNDLGLAALKHSLANDGVYAISVNSLPGLGPDEVAAAGRLLCDAAQVVGGKLYILGGGWSYQYLQSPDNPITEVVALDFTIPWGRTNVQLAIVVAITDEDGEAVTTGDDDRPVRMEGNIVVGCPPTARAGADIHVPVVIPFSPFRVDPGGYVCEVTVDGDPVARTGFQVMNLPTQFQPGGPA